MDFIAHMEDAMTIHPDEPSFVADFAAFVLGMMRYDGGHGRRVVHQRRAMGFEMCGQHVDAQADVVVMDRSGTGASHLLLVEEDKVRKRYLCMLKIRLPATRYSATCIGAMIPNHN